MQSSAAVTADTAGLLCSRCSRSRRPQAAQAAAELQTKHQGRPAEQSGLSGSTCLMEPAILSGSDHYPALQPTPPLNNDQE